MKVLAFGASTSSQSINSQLALYAARQVNNAEVTHLKLETLELPIYSSDEEESNGIPADAQTFSTLIQQHDAIVVSLAEHNGSYTAAFKNIYDWASRVEYNVWANKPLLLLSTSPGARGGATVLEAAKATFPRMGAELIDAISVPSFFDNFDAETQTVTDEAIATSIKAAAGKLDTVSA